ncbi:hypothetical protein ACIOYV_00485 [Pseudomonas sp. NPDC087342]|uniref:hypothetical protein n=1 Tax=Pseudomonas sp. NPDC087342 TaxID=3364437 RepID=UPI0037F2508F
MKILSFVFLLALLLILNIGYYNALEDGDVESTWFFKKTPTFQIKFYNIHANDGEIRKIESLTEEQREKIVDYCKYRLGIKTNLTTQDDVEACRKK